MYRSLFPRDLFAEFERLQRDMSSVLEPSPSIRGLGRSGYPALNVGTTANSIELYALAPGLDPQSIEINLDRGVMTLSGERPGLGAASSDRKTTYHQSERFAGRFHRVVSLPDDIDPHAVSAKYRDGVLHVSVQRRASAQPRRIEVQ